jgi:hypothetical protein
MSVFALENMYAVLLGGKVGVRIPRGLAARITHLSAHLFADRMVSLPEMYKYLYVHIEYAAG